jgi:hypothetical protein
MVFFAFNFFSARVVSFVSSEDELTEETAQAQ